MTSEPPNSPTSAQAHRREPSLSPPPYVLDKHGSRVLDPDSAVRVKGQTIRPTVYVGASLLVRARDWADERVQSALGSAARSSGLRPVPQPADPELQALAQQAELVELGDRLLMVKVALEPLDEHNPAAPPDAWPVLQQYRVLVRDEPGLADVVTLDHLLTATGIGGAGYMGTGYMGTGYMGTGYMGTGYMGTATPSADYGMPGRGGRAPVAWLGPEPARRPDDDLLTRRPVVALLDTGAGTHDWLPDSIVDRNPTVDGTLPIGLPDGPYNPEVHGAVNDPLEGVLDSDAGHGTFIAGLIRQTCPDAGILAVRVMHGDGAVQENDLLRALNRLVFRQALALRHDDRDSLVDVLSLSLGYYHELPADLAMDHKLLAPLAELGKLGVLIVAAAGNDATDRHFYPAGFAPHPLTQLPPGHNTLPVLSVGALNPDKNYVALFSNDGDWVVCKRPGAALVSTMPALNGSLLPVASVTLPDGERRATIDPDDFSGGFATWSGTSFAAPVLAGQLAQYLHSEALLEPLAPATDAPPLTAQRSVERGWLAITSLTGLKRPGDGAPVAQPGSPASDGGPPTADDGAGEPATG